MKSLFKTTLFIMLVTLHPATVWGSLNQANPSERNYFQFVIPKYHTRRQGGQTVSVYVRYAYKKSLPTNKYPDYRLLRTQVLTYMEPTNEFPAEVFWEILATKMGKTLMKDYPLDGISIQMTVYDNQDPNTYEPGDHGPIFTMGNIAPLDVH